MHEELDLVLLGGVGAGKGTQARRLAALGGIPHISSGDLLRQHRREGTPLGRAADAYMQRGQLVPDDLVIGLIGDRLRAPDAATGFVLDGFPRTVAQAEALDRLLASQGRRLSRVLFLSVPTAVLQARAAGRLICPVCGASYNVQTNPPRLACVCDLDGATLIRRDDDRPEVIAARVEEDKAQQGPLLAYYRERGLLREIDGSGSIDEVTEALRQAIDSPEGVRD